MIMNDVSVVEAPYTHIHSGNTAETHQQEHASGNTPETPAETPAGTHTRDTPQTHHHRHTSRGTQNFTINPVATHSAVCADEAWSSGHFYLHHPYTRCTPSLLVGMMQSTSCLSADCTEELSDAFLQHTKPSKPDR